MLKDRFNVGVFMATPDFEIRKFDYGIARTVGVEVFDELRDDYEFRDGQAFALRRELRDEDSIKVLTGGYLKYFVIGVTRADFRAGLAPIFTAPVGFFPIARETGFLGAVWRPLVSSRRLVEAAKHRCTGRCNPPSSCREELCRCNTALGRCV